MEKEQRYISNPGAFFIEKRDDGKEYIGLHAIVFNQWSQVLGGWFKEKVNPRALDGCDMSDVLNKFNHDINFVLGRTPDTLALEVRDNGLFAFTEYDPEDPDHVRVRRKIDKKIIRGASFEFSLGEKGSIWTTEIGSEYELREIVQIAKLYDVAPVINPAYLQTGAGISQRSIESAKEEHDRYLAEQRGADSQQEQATNIDNADSIAAEHDLLAMEFDI